MVCPKQIILLSLYVAQTVPMSFFSSVVPVIMREEAYPLELIGWLQFIKFPWILKVFWAPLIDNKSSVLSDYKRWIIGSELIYAAIIISIAFLNLDHAFLWIIILMVAAITASATQDIATDALSIRIIERKKRSLGAGMQSMGGFIGSLLGGGVLLMAYKWLGWTGLLCGLAGAVLLALLPLLLYKGSLNESADSGRKYVSLRDLFLFFKQSPAIWRHTGFLILFYSGIAMLLAMLRPYLVDLNYSAEEIGFLTGILGTIAAAVCSFLTGHLIRRTGKQKVRKMVSWIILFSTAYLCFTTYLGLISPFFIYSAVIFIWASFGMATVVLYTMAMEKVREGREGTDFTLQTVLVQLFGMILAGFSGWVADSFSYGWLFFFAVLLSAVSLIHNSFLYKE